MSKDRLEELGKELIKEILDSLPVQPSDGGQYAAIMGVIRPLIKELTTFGQIDGRHALYSVRLVLHRADSDEIENVSPWFHDVPGMAGVWRTVEELGAGLADGMGLAGCPVELTASELDAKTSSARVSMSRKKNGVAAIRVQFATMTGGARLRPDAPGKAEKWTLRVDVGTTENGKALHQQEIAAASPLVV